MDEVFINQEADPYVLEADGTLDVAVLQLQPATVVINGKKGLVDVQNSKTKRTFAEIQEKILRDATAGSMANPLQISGASLADTGEPGDLKHILKQLMDAMQDNMTLARLVLRGQLRPVSSSASTKRQEEYRLRAIEYYYGSHADKSKIRCMVTGEEVDLKAITAGHIYRQGWPTGLLKVMGCRLYEPRNIILMQNQLEKRFDNWEWTIVPEGPDAFRIHVLSPRLLDPKGREQYVAAHAGKGTKWRDIDGTLLQLPMTARPARRLCGLHAMLAIQEAETKGWFDETHEAPKMAEASWQSPTFDHLLMDKYLNDAKDANMHMSDPDTHCL